MTTTDLTHPQQVTKAAILLEALPYIQKYRDSVFVIKYGGSFMDTDDPLPHMREIAKDIVFLQLVGIKPVIVHGGGKAISRAMKSANLTPKFVHGYRITDEKTIEIVEQVLNHQINPQIVQTINEAGGQAVGLLGIQVYSCCKATIQTPDGQSIDLGYVGEINNVNTEFINNALNSGKIPVISPTAKGPDGKIYNCNADTAAAETAIALRARKLIYMTDVPGLMMNPNDPSTLLSTVTLHELETLKSRGIINGGMIPKVNTAVRAVRAGVEKVSMVDARLPHSILIEVFTDTGIGTEIVL